MFIIKNDNLKQMFLQLDTLLSSIEVKGDSVEGLFKSRMILKDLFTSIEEVKREEENAI